MKKVIFAALALALSITSVQSNAQSFQEGDVIISAGYGANTLGRQILKAIEQEDAEIDLTGHNPIFAKLEYAISDKWGLGVNFFASNIGFKQSYDYEVLNETGTFTTNRYEDSYSYKVNAISLRFNRHWEVTEKFDVYFGFGGGTKWGKLEYKSNNPERVEGESINPIPFAMECTMGARYYFTENIGIYSEIGIARSFFQGGLAIKF